MSRQLKHVLKKIITITLIIVALFFLWKNFLNASSTGKTIEDENNKIYKNINNKEIWKIWVAVSVNIWTSYKNKKEITDNIHNSIFSVSDIESQKNEKWFLWENMFILDEYRNILKSDFNNILKWTSNKSDMLEAIIDQLEYRYSISVEQMKELEDLSNGYKTKMGLANSEIEVLKQKISNDYNNRNAVESENNIKKYVEIKDKYYNSKINIVYIYQFIKEYSLLNNYNKLLLDTLINNKEALIKETYVVIPDSGANLLKKFDLLYTEEEIKNK